MNPSPTRRLIVTFVLIVGLVSLAWWFLISHSFIKVSLGDTSRVQVMDAQTNKTVAEATAERWLNLPTGDYLFSYYQGDSITSMQSRHIGAFSFGSVAATVGDNQKLSTILKRPADFVTPLGSGVIYVDKNTRGVSYAQGGTVTDLSSQLGLTSDPNASLQLSAQPIYNGVVNIQAVSGGKVCITTTRNIYLLSSPSNIATLALYNHGTLNYTTSAYDAQTNKLYAMVPRTSSLYRYDLGQPDQVPTELKTSARIMNRITAGNGKLILSYDDVPNTTAAVLSQYDVRYQVTPIIVDADTGKTLRELSDYRASTHISISGNGHYAAIKRKWANTITVYDLERNSTRSIPAYDTGGITWKQDVAYVARAGAVWSYDATSQAAGLTRVGTVNEAATRLSPTATGLLVSTNADTTSLLSPAGTAAPAIPPAIIAAPSANPLIYYLPSPETD